MNIKFKKIIMLVGVFAFNLSYQSGAFAGEHEKMQHTATKQSNKKDASATMQLVVKKILTQGNKKRVFLALTNKKTHRPVGLKNLKKVHTRKVHLLIIDDTLKDYSHIHPKETQVPGVYVFDWYPKRKNANYRVWADLVPLDTNKQEYVITDLMVSNAGKSTINRKLFEQSTTEGLTFKLSFADSNLQVGKPTMGKVDIIDSEGNPVKNLEPIMGAYAHIVGFNDDFKNVVHIHPMGKEPQNASDRGGPQLNFHVEPEKGGFVKMFVQIQRNGKEIFAPFAVNIKG